MNVFEKAIASISPETALKRAHAKEKLRILNTGYSHHGASRRKKGLAGWDSSGGSTREDIDKNLSLLRERSRDLMMGAPLAAGALKTIRTNVVGSGLKLNAQIDAKYLGMNDDEAARWNDHVEREFALWADSAHCDAQRVFNFYQLQQLAKLTWLVSGEAFATLRYNKRVNMPYDLRLHLFEPDRVCSPGLGVDVNLASGNEIINGVEVNSTGEIVAYHVANRHPGEMSLQSLSKEWVRVQKYGTKTGRPNILHMFDAERPEQRRGVPLLAPVVETIKQLTRYTEAEVMAAVVSGMFTVFIETKPETEGPALGQLDEEIDDFEGYDNDEKEAIKMGYGQIVELAEGETIKDANPGRPNTAFDGFVTSLVRQIGTAIELPYELVIKHFTASYSASRAALLEAWKMFRMRRVWLASGFCQPVYEEWLAEAIAKGRVDAPGFFDDPAVRKAYCKAEWNGPAQGQLDPVKEVKAAQMRVEAHFSTRTKEAMELTNSDFNQVVELRKREEELIKEGGLAVE